MECVQCKKDGVSRDGGDLGGCSKHARRRCGICDGPSLTGAEECPGCENRIAISRRQHLADNPQKLPDYQSFLDLAPYRKELLRSGIHLLHQALDSMGQGAERILEAFAGHVEIDHKKKAA